MRLDYYTLFSEYLYTSVEPNSAGEVSGHCPFHVDDKPSFSFNISKGLWHCFSCHKGGTPTYFVQLIEDCSRDEAERKINTLLGKPVLPTDLDLVHWKDNIHEAGSVMAYLERRGVNDPELIKKYELGWDGERITVPVRDADGSLLNVRRLRVSEDGDKVLNWRGFGRVQVWPMDQLQGETILLCAGEIDTLSAIQQGYNAVTGTGGESVWRSDLNGHFTGKTVYVVYDGDETGREGGKARAQDLLGIAKNVYLVHLPEGEDVNSLHVQEKPLSEYVDMAVLVGMPGARLVSGQDLLDEAQEEAKRPWLIEGLLRPGWLGVIGGHGKSGKTTLTAHLMRSLATGEPFLGFEVKKSPTMYVSYEMAVVDLVELFTDVMGETPEDWPSTLLEPPRPLLAEELQPFLDITPGIVVVDSATPAFALRGDSENQAGEVGFYLRSLQELARKTGWAVLIIHHTKKSSTGSYLDLAGSREWIAAPDVIMTWEKGAIGSPGVLRVEGRVPPIESMAVLLDRSILEPMGSTEQITKELVYQQIRETLINDAGLTTKEIGKRLEMNHTTVWRHMTEGPFFSLGTGKRGNPYVWYTRENIPEGVQSPEENT